MATTSPTSAEHRGLWIRLPRPLWFVVATVVVIASGLGIRIWVSNSWNKRTINQFLKHARNGDIDECRAMLADDPSTVWLLDPHILRITANRSLTTEQPSILDLMIGRQRYRVNLAYANDLSITVAHGRVTLGSAFWIQYIPPGPDFLDMKAKSEPMEIDRPPL